MTVRLVVTLAVLTSACREASSTTDERGAHIVVSPPCADCTVDLPQERTNPQPVLVVLHGNREDASDAAARWRDAALAKGVAVLGLTCPRSRGCDDGKWYKWPETPRFVEESLATLARDVPIDPARTYLAGWSGGASAIGQHLGAWDAFSAIVIHGGGQAPRDGACPPRPMPTYFLVGDANPAHPAAIRLREHMEKCAQPIEWDLLPRANHRAEDRALDREKAMAILDWIADHQ